MLRTYLDPCLVTRELPLIARCSGRAHESGNSVCMVMPTRNATAAAQKIISPNNMASLNYLSPWQVTTISE